MSQDSSRIQRMRSCYAVDMQGDKLAIARGERVRGRVVCQAVAFGDPSAMERLKSGAACVGCMTTRESFARWLEAPFASAAKAMKVLPTLLDVDLPFELEQCVHLFAAVASTPRKTTRALAVAARVSDIEKSLAKLKEFGVDPIALDHEGLALWTQSLAESPARADEMGALRVVAYLGADRVSLAIGRGGEFLSAHAARSKDPDHISLLLRAYQEPKLGRTRWIWCGPGAEERETVERLRIQLEKEWPGTFEIVSEPAMFLARGLATRALTASDLPCNLRAGALAHPAVVEGRKRRAFGMAIAAVCAGLLLCGTNAAIQLVIRQKEARLDQLFAAKAGELAGYDIGSAKGEHAIKMVRDKVDKRLDMTRPFMNAFKPSLVGMIDRLAEIGKKQDLRYDFLSLNGEKATITGTAGDWNSCDRIVAYLGEMGYSAKLERKEALGGDRVPFSITGGGSR